MIEYVTVSPGFAACERTALTSLLIDVAGPFGPAIAAPGCATANSLPPSVARPFAVAAFVERAVSAIGNAAPTTAPVVAIATWTLTDSPGCSAGETVLPTVSGSGPDGVRNAAEVIVPAPVVSDCTVYASGTLPAFAIVNVRTIGVPTGNPSVAGSTAVSLGETAIAETAAIETEMVLDWTP